MENDRDNADDDRPVFYPDFDFLGMSNGQKVLSPWRKDGEIPGVVC